MAAVSDPLEHVGLGEWLGSTATDVDSSYCCLTFAVLLPTDEVTIHYENEVLLSLAAAYDLVEYAGLEECLGSTATGGGSDCYCLTFVLLPPPPFAGAYEPATHLLSFAAGASMLVEQEAAVREAPQWVAQALLYRSVVGHSSYWRLDVVLDYGDCAHALECFEGPDIAWKVAGKSLRDHIAGLDQATTCLSK